MTRTLENDTERECAKIIKSLGGLSRKLDVGHGAKGWLDRAVWLPGWHFVVEFKQPGEKLTPLQIKKREALQTLGVEVCTVCDVVEFIQLLQFNQIKLPRHLLERYQMV